MTDRLRIVLWTFWMTFVWRKRLGVWDWTVLRDVWRAAMRHD
jgi:hypothetical protein